MDFDTIAAEREAAMREAARTTARLWCVCNPEAADKAADVLADQGELPTLDRLLYLGALEGALYDVLRARRPQIRTWHYWPQDDFA
jgi:hypothetical protein